MNHTGIMQFVKYFGLSPVLHLITLVTAGQGFSVHGNFQARILELVAFPPPRDLPDPRIEHVSLESPALAVRFFTTSSIWEALIYLLIPY